MLLDVIIDISKYQLNPEYGKIKEAGIKGIILKATQGTTFVDTVFDLRWEKVQQHGFLRGAYHFATDAPGIAQAEHFLDITKPEATDLLVLDWEEHFRTKEVMSRGDAEEFVLEVFNQTGKYPVIYTRKDIVQAAKVKESSVLLNCPLWLARYGKEPEIPAPWTEYKMWQYTDNGQVAGITGPVDRDKFLGTIEELHSFWGVSYIAEAVNETAGDESGEGKPGTVKKN